jgi:glycine cleavage system regulatory protein
MATLAGQFAGIVHVRCKPDSADALTRDLVDLQSQGLVVHVTRSTNSEEADTSPRRMMELELLGLDRPGIVRDVAQALADRGVSVTDLQTSTENAPMSGEAMFRATARLGVPTNGDVDALHDALEQVARQLDLDLDLRAASSPASA